MMLKPFRIRDLHGSSSQNIEDVSRGPSNPHGVVQVSAADYDNIALNYPRARLTYLDDDDGDQIMVGSSLELSQRLDEPLDIDTRLSNVQLAEDELVPMHIFDIRRSNSVTELWRQFERDNGGIRAQQMTGNTPVETQAAIDEPVHEKQPASHDAHVAPAPEDENQSFMTAFEAELASLLHSAENTEQRATQPGPSSATESSSSGTSPQRTHHPLEVVAATFLYHLVHGANSVQSELRSRLPELQDQLRNAQRTLPENVRSSLQSLLATIEAHMRTAFQNLPDNGRQLAEDAINAGRPVAEHAADGLRMMASELNEAGRTLFAAFENEFGRFAPNGQNATSEGLHAAASVFTGATADGTVSDPSSQDMNPHSTDPGVPKRETASSGPSSAQSPELNTHTLPSDLESPGWDKLREQKYDFYPADPHHHPPFPPRSPHPPAPPMPPRHWSPIPPPHPRPPYHHPYHPPWQMPWNPVYPIQHFPPATPLSPPPGAGIYPGQPWLPTNLWFNSFGPHNPDSAPPAPPTKETSRDTEGSSDTPETKVLFIGNVGFNVNERMIQDVFASKGFLVSVRLAYDSDTGRHAGFGYIHFPSSHPAMAAMDALQGVHIDGHAINLEFSDDPLIDSVHPPESPAYAEPRTQYETFARQDRPESRDAKVSSPDEIGLGAAAAQPARTRRGGRRKSVTFQEPEISSLDLPGEDAIAEDVQTRLQSPPLIDFTADDTATYHQSNEMQDQLPEMSRFPPVSQLEAQLFANTQQSRTSEITPDAPAREAANQSTRSLKFDRPKSWYEPIPYEPQPSYNAHGEELSALRDGGRQKRMGLGGQGLRRSNTATRTRRGGEPSDVPSATLWGNFPNNSPLRRYASERHSLRRDTRDSSETDTWARLDRRERRRSRYSSRLSIPGSFPLEEAYQPATVGPLDASVETQETDIDRCISSLVDMGYGTAGDGGQARMAVYAAASNGNLYDAIEMIEEERKAYACQGRE